MAEKKRVILRHAELMLKYKGEKLGIMEMRKHLAWYTAGLPGSAKLRNDMNGMETLSDLQSLVDRL